MNSVKCVCKKFKKNLLLLLFICHCIIHMYFLHNSAFQVAAANIIVITKICSWLPPVCKQNLPLFIQPRWQLRRYFFNHHNFLFS